MAPDRAATVRRSPVIEKQSFLPCRKVCFVMLYVTYLLGGGKRLVDFKVMHDRAFSQKCGTLTECQAVATCADLILYAVIQGQFESLRKSHHVQI